MEIVNEIGKVLLVMWWKGILKIDLNNLFKYIKKLGKIDNVLGNLEVFMMYVVKCV